ncbi:MAG TPA: L-threonylcarbamoyladenylate synthase [Syntrophorhabdales bacterium]|nr:L-threonylcarbamoyladenylate synthase [Syntrophorhabdales bacterium]
MDAHPMVLDGFQPASIERAVTALKAGDVVAFPTETVYGLGADALNSIGVAKIFEIKKRPHFDPLIVHIGQKEWLPSIARRVPQQAQLLIERFWPGPLTIILEKHPSIPDIVTAGLPTVAVRMPSHPVALNLINAFGRPIAAPSANPFGYMSPTRAAHVARMFENRLALVLDGGPSTFGLESTIVAVKDHQIFVRRYGAVTLEELRDLVSEVHEEARDGAIDSPGQLPYHYAPHRPLTIIRTLDEARVSASSLLLFRTPSKTPLSKYVRILSPTGNLREAAANFFSYLIELDREDVDIIYAEKIPETGLGTAMMERLKKATRKTL